MLRSPNLPDSHVSQDKPIRMSRRANTVLWNRGWNTALQQSILVFQYLSSSNPVSDSFSVFTPGVFLPTVGLGLTNAPLAQQSPSKLDRPWAGRLSICSRPTWKKNQDKSTTVGPRSPRHLLNNWRFISLLETTAAAAAAAAKVPRKGGEG